MPISTVGNPINKQAGFTYILMLVAIIVSGIVAGTASIPVTRLQTAEREQELLFRGQAYRNAIKNYYATARRYPRSLNELVKDSAFVHRVYLRALYADPMSPDGKGEWNVIRAVDGGISGVASRSTATPMKQANFPEGLENFSGSAAYADWVFEYSLKPNPTSKIM
jgi:type II secretory pathway pseudopilin PulG